MIYLDHAASTNVFPAVLDAMLPWVQAGCVGNPSSIHTQGIHARRAIEKAREQVAQMIGANPSEVFFTSGGTESNNAWLRCLTKPAVLTTPLEHHSVLNPLRQAEYIKVNPDGMIDIHDLERHIRICHNDIGAVSVMWVNNELGTINPVSEIGRICKEYGIPFHTDAVAAAGHIKMDVHRCHIDFLSLSGHKFGAPQGIGVLYIANRIQKKSWLYGGGQEKGLRGGTENVPGIVGIGKAAEIVMKNLSSWDIAWKIMRNHLIKALASAMPDEFWVNGNPDYCIPSILSLTIPGVNAESLLLLLDQKGIYISAGSACAARGAAISHVLKGIGMSDIDATCTVRISMGVDTLEEDVVYAAHEIAAAVHKLKSMSP